LFPDIESESHELRMNDKKPITCVGITQETYT